MEFKIGQRIECLDEYRGEVAFIGKLKGRDSVYVGIRLDKPVGKNSGMYAGDRYFIAGKNQGIFVKYEHLKELERTNRIIEENLSLVSRDVSKIGPLSLDKAAKILASHKDETMYMDISSLDKSFALENEEYSISKNVNEFLKENKIDFLKNEKKKSEKKENKPLSKYDKAKEYYRLLKEKNKLKEMNEYLKENTSLIENSDKTFEETLNNTSNINNTNNLENLKNNKINKIDTLKFYDQKEFCHQRPKEMEEEMKLLRDSKKSIETINDSMKSVQKDLEDAEKELREEIKKRKGLEEMVKNKVSLVLYNLKSTVRELKECFSQIKNYKLKEKGNLYFLLMNVVNSLEKKDVNSVNKNLEMFKKEVEKKGIRI